MSKTKYDEPTIWNILDLVNALASEYDWTEEETKALTPWIEQHYVHGEAISKTIMRFKRSKVGQKTLQH